jgi:exopolysaccharide production protein ExoZ
VIVHASAPLFGQPGGAVEFLRRRLARIVPLYWITTTAFLTILLVSHTSIHADIGGAAYIIASYLFIPWQRPDGVMQPAFGLGWTLNYELFFYVFFAAFLLLNRRPAVILATIVLCVFVAFGVGIGFRNPQLEFWSHPIVLEFAAGMGAALGFANGLRLRTPACIGLVILAIAAFHLASFAPAGFRALIYGLPALMLVCAATLGHVPERLNIFDMLLLRLGAASYAMYLVHPFIMRLFTALWRRFHVLNELSGIIYVVTGLVVAQLVALGIHATIEVRLSAALRRAPKVLNNAAV